MSLLVSIHDVTPALMPKVEVLWRCCRDHGVTPALLVVPDWHGGWPIEGHPEFVRWVREAQEEGAEIFLHGERHDEVGSPRALGDHLRALGRTAREGEFLTLDFERARTRIARGLERFARLGLSPIGFIPPAWLAREEGFRAAAACGLRVSEDDGGIRLLDRGVRLPSPVVRWSARTTSRALLSVAVHEARWRWQRDARWLRIAYHPADLDHPATARDATAALARWLPATPVARYADLSDATTGAPRAA